VVRVSMRTRDEAMFDPAKHLIDSANVGDPLPNA
jgi:hypothetical protein